MPRTMRTINVGLSAIVLVSLMQGVTAAAPPAYRILLVEPLTPPGAMSGGIYLADVNDKVIAVGSTSWVDAAGVSHSKAVVVNVNPLAPETFETRYLNDLVARPLEWDLRSATCITQSGLICGTFCRTTGGPGGGYVCSTAGDPPYPIQELPAEFTATGRMSEQGHMLGAVGSSYAVAVVKSDSPPNAVYEVRLLPAKLLNATDINDQLQVVGELEKVGREDAHRTACVYQWIGNSFSQTHTFDTARSWTRKRINASGVVGHSVVKKGGTTLAAYFDTNVGKSTPFASEWSASQDINSVGQACGMYATKGNQRPRVGFVYDPVQGFWALSDLAYSPDPAVEAIFLEQAGSVYERFSLSDPVLASGTAFPAIINDAWPDAIAFILVPER